MVFKDINNEYNMMLNYGNDILLKYINNMVDKYVNNMVFKLVNIVNNRVFKNEQKLE